MTPTLLEPMSKFNKITSFKNQLCAGGMVQCGVKVLATKSEDVRLISGPHMVEGKKRLP